MDGIHDLGGKQGFGPIDVSAPPFSHDWEKRMWAVAKNSGAPDWTLDWWRCVAEQIPPATYLSVSYFEKWCLTYMSAFLCSGVFTREEILSGHTENRALPAAPSGVAGALERLRANELFFDRPLDTPPAFSIGDRVETVRHTTSRHSRLPAYARGRCGAVIAHHGGHIFADANARGEDEVQHLYTVEFRAVDLWGEEADARDTVTLDLWESYLVQP